MCTLKAFFFLYIFTVSCRFTACKALSFLTACLSFVPHTCRGFADIKQIAVLVEATVLSEEEIWMMPHQ